MERACGVLLPVFSLPGNYGIGSFSKEAYAFIDFLKEAGQTYWQILPLGPTSYGDSPYQAFSTFAGNPYFIDLDDLVNRGWLAKKDITKFNWGDKAPGNPSYVDYEKIYNSRFKVLKKAYENSNIAKDPDFIKYVAKNKRWLVNYATYMAIKDANGSVSYLEWDEDIRLRKKDALLKWTQKCAKEIEFYEFQQYLFYTQWKKLKKYANSKGIKIIGDIPIYVALDSADTWADPKLFKLDSKGYPTSVAGCPPDYFSEDGQLWGNPLYDWEYHKKTGYEWWIRRFKQCFDLYDIVRIDHFRGFEDYYSIPYGDKNARRGKWIKGPGWDLFRVVKEKFKDKEIIAEDLGFITPPVRRLIKKCGYPGMKIMLYGFETDAISEHAPFTYEKNSVVYTGTHDNDTITDWFKYELGPKDREYIRKYMNFKGNKDIAWNYIRTGMSTVSDTAIFPIQDYLGLGNEAKINSPSTLGNNWKWRLTEGMLSKELAEKMFDMAYTFHRIPTQKSKGKSKF
ncbi:MAG: 4-alpha-glucanotransferase [Lachnospiraceae bacterium]|nr:4-alpha-glucanotransferase [Lachnospiraceae bacterium]